MGPVDQPTAGATEEGIELEGGGLTAVAILQEGMAEEPSSCVTEDIPDTSSNQESLEATTDATGSPDIVTTQEIVGTERSEPSPGIAMCPESGELESLDAIEDQLTPEDTESVMSEDIEEDT